MTLTPKEQKDHDWSVAITELIADGLVDGGAVDASSLDRAKEIIAEEIFIRLTLNDRPGSSQ